MKKISIAFVAAMALASFGCKKKGAAEAMGKMNDFRDKMCACKDKACADKVIDDLVTFMKDNKNARGDEEKAKAAGQRLGMCVVTAGADPTEFMTKMNSVM